MKHHDSPVLIRAVAMDDGGTDQQEFIRREWPFNRISKSYAVPLGVTHSSDGLENPQQPRIEVRMLSFHSPAIKSAKPGEVVAFVGSVFHAVREKRS